MLSLDKPEAIRRHDPKDMYGLTAAFAEQCDRALEIARSADLPPLEEAPTLVVLTGLGGSAAGGDFMRALFEHQASTPFLVNRESSMPEFVGPKTLVFATSYSGNTEETLAAYEDAKKRGAKIVAITSGGKLAERAARDGFPVIQVPGGQPPRTALGFLLVPGVVACERFGLLPAQPWDEALQELRAAREDWKLEVPESDNPTKKVARTLHGKLPVVYGLGGWQAVVAGRWKGQINENSKAMIFANAFPELCHNEILGWENSRRQSVQDWAAVYLEDGAEPPKMAKRGEVVEAAIPGPVVRVRARGDSLLAKMLTLTSFGDFVSLYLAALLETDPHAMDAIEDLKAQLADLG